MPLILTPHKRLRGALVANLSSLLFDYVARQKIGGLNLNFCIVKQLTVLPPSAYAPELLDLIAPKIVEIVYAAYDVAPFARDCGYDGPPFVWNEERRAHLRAELDSIYAHLQRITKQLS